MVVNENADSKAVVWIFVLALIVNLGIGFLLGVLHPFQLIALALAEAAFLGMLIMGFAALFEYNDYKLFPFYRVFVTLCLVFLFIFSVDTFINKSNEILNMKRAEDKTLIQPCINQRHLTISEQSIDCSRVFNQFSLEYIDELIVELENE